MQAILARAILHDELNRNHVHVQACMKIRFLPFLSPPLPVVRENFIAKSLAWLTVFISAFVCGSWLDPSFKVCGKTYLPHAFKEAEMNFFSKPRTLRKILKCGRLSNGIMEPFGNPDHN